jgi:hypothetical protein
LPARIAATTAMTDVRRRHISPHLFAQGIGGVRSSREAAGAPDSPVGRQPHAPGINTANTGIPLDRHTHSRSFSKRLAHLSRSSFRQKNTEEIVDALSPAGKPAIHVLALMFRSARLAIPPYLATPVRAGAASVYPHRPRFAIHTHLISRRRKQTHPTMAVTMIKTTLATTLCIMNAGSFRCSASRVMY